MSSSTTSFKTLPVSWTDDKDELYASCFSSKEYGLGPGQKILYNNALSTYLIDCDGYLLWNEVSDRIDQIQEPTKLEEIFKVLPDASNYKVPNYSKMKLAGVEVEQESR